MKKLYSFVAAAMFAATAFGQTTLLSEDFGTTNTLPAGWVSTSTSNGWNGNTTNQSNNSGASGGTNAVFIGNGSNGITHTLTYSLSTVGYSNVNIIWAGKGTSTFAQNITFQWSTDGTTWNNVTYTYSKNANSWALVNGGVAIQLPVQTENAASLSLRWSSVTNNNGNYRIDDVKVVGTAASLGTSNLNISKNVFVKNTVVNNDITFGAKSDVKIFNMAGQVVKTTTVSENQSLNVSDLKEGTYIVTGTVNGKFVSEKVIKK
ncbi:T9SS type A sorting domain-containing protein [Chryseobacterium viscerum]|uniref:T9SS C-terminal target domain-containing protein n=1 Tax=Chryseobacterium viscerum TaxID=1037377 RepID=A0A316WKA1_9FLAO|nr:T9SS type A sorting domain-containing protein [Chryseobacterium viscerum]PWN61599.1 T9SS C-terminal target domain-containing protein [Chryseobacterium viscerum]